MFNYALPIMLAVAAGISLIVQQALNANLRAALGSAAWSGFTSYLVGTICMVLLAVALRDPVQSAAVAARVPWWAWSGGLFGAIFIGLAILLIPQIGAATLRGPAGHRSDAGLTGARPFWSVGRAGAAGDLGADGRRGVSGPGRGPDPAVAA